MKLSTINAALAHLGLVLVVSVLSKDAHAPVPFVAPESYMVFRLTSRRAFTGEA